MATPFVATSVQVWQIGDVVVRAIPEFSTWPVDDLIADATPEACARFADWLPAQFLTPQGQQLSIQGFVVESQGRRVVVDTCIGNSKKRRNRRLDQLNTPFLDTLRAVAGPPESIDVVICTHLHSDHVGWNTVRREHGWVPTFPNARYLLSEIELDYFRQVVEGDAPEIIADSIQPVLDHDLVELVAPGKHVTDEVSLMSTPGHTIGHVSVWIESNGASALITGDALHHPVQIVEPGWRSNNDYDRRQAADSRRSIVERCIAKDALLIGSHFVAPSGVRLSREAGRCVPRFVDP